MTSVSLPAPSSPAASSPAPSLSAADAAFDPMLELPAYAAQLDTWLAVNADLVGPVAAPDRNQNSRIEKMRDFMARVHEAGWSRYGWPHSAGGLGGTIAHRAIMWESFARHGVPSMELFEHLEVLIPTVVEHGRPEFVAHALPALLAGTELWSQGFSEPDSGSDLAALRTVATASEGGWTITGRKIWTSWAPWARWCLVLARTGPADSRHRGLTAFVVDLHYPGVEVRAIEQADGNAELAEVTFDAVSVPDERVVGEVGGGWAVAMHILSHERGTFAWFRQCFLLAGLNHALALGHPSDDSALGNAVLDLAAVAAASHAAIEAHAADQPLGPRATFTKLLLCTAEQSVNDWVLASDPDLSIDLADDEVALRRQEYIFSRIVTVYGGSQQMQLETIAKQILRLP